jgi:hypothetical protein
VDPALLLRVKPAFEMDELAGSDAETCPFASLRAPSSALAEMVRSSLLCLDLDEEKERAPSRSSSPSLSGAKPGLVGVDANCATCITLGVISSPAGKGDRLVRPRRP